MPSSVTSSTRKDDFEQVTEAPPNSSERLDDAIDKARKSLVKLQHPSGYWCFELEADCTIPAEYILMMHFMGEVDADVQSKIAVYLREHQQEEGGWPLYTGGDMDVSCSVKAYYALKLAGDSPDESHMRKARTAILRQGGAARSNVFTRITLALFDQVPWRAVPFIPVEIILLPRWFPFHLSKVSYWSRTVMVPLLILCSMRARAQNPTGTGVRELFVRAPEAEPEYFQARSWLNRLFLVVERMGRKLEPLIPKRVREHAIRKAEHWFLERLNGTSGLGAIFPAMVNAHEVLAVLGYPSDHPLRKTTRQALENLLIIEDERAYCQPCVSPVWDTGLSVLALQEVNDQKSVESADRALNWLAKKQLLEQPGDWQYCCPDVPGGGWAFQFQNDHYPDVDDTSVVAWAMHRQDPKKYAHRVRRAADWICAMQSSNGGFAAFDADNTSYYLNEIPFADHGALLDPPTSDVSARCVSLLSQIVDEDPRYSVVMKRCIDYLRMEQESDGAWFGRWGTNYVYGTWSILEALRQAKVPRHDVAVQRAVDWLRSAQREDGGWGESNDSYADKDLRGCHDCSTSFQTAWALLGLMAVGEGDSPTVRRGIKYLLRNQEDNGLWNDWSFTAPGFPRVFYLKYHGYDKYFPLWALARYRNLMKADRNG